MKRLGSYTRQEVKIGALGRYQYCHRSINVITINRVSCVYTNKTGNYSHEYR